MPQKIQAFYPKDAPVASCDRCGAALRHVFRFQSLERDGWIYGTYGSECIQHLAVGFTKAVQQCQRKAAAQSIDGDALVDRLKKLVVGFQWREAGMIYEITHVDWEKSKLRAVFRGQDGKGWGRTQRLTIAQLAWVLGWI